MKEAQLNQTGLLNAPIWCTSMYVQLGLERLRIRGVAK